MSQEHRTEQMADDDLVRRFRQGEEEAFLALYRRHQGAVFRFALHMSGNRETAEEVTQEVFLGLLASQCRYDPARGSLEAFLVGAARNQVRRQERLLRVTPALKDSNAAALSGSMDEGDLELLRRAVLELPPKYREIVVLCELEELSYAETAARLECAVGTVRSRLHRARALLASKLGGQKKMRGKEACAT